MKNHIRSIAKMVYRFGKNCSFNYTKTVLLNFSLLPFRQAIKFPIIVYSPCSTLIRRSRIVIDKSVKLRFGLIALGKNSDMFVSPKERMLIMMLDSAIHISGDFRMSSGCTLRIDHGILHLGKDVGIGGGCKVLCNNKITIGDYTRVAFGCVITDTDFHYISMNNIVKDCSRPVIIHDRVWIGNNCAVGKGTILPPQSILATRSMANKDYSNYGNGILFAGIPAKVIRTGCYKIHNRKIEKQIHQHYFSTNEVYIITKKEFDKSQIR